jgi:uncharacterized protein (TIGR02145 family)
MQKVLNLIVLVCLMIAFATFNSCKKEDIPARIPIVLETTPDASATITTSVGEVLTGSTAAISGNVTSMVGLFVVARGICYNTVPNPIAYESNSYIEQEVQSYEWTGKFTVSLTNLTPGKFYYVRAFVAVMTGTDYGDQLVIYGNEVTFNAGDPKSVSGSIIYNPDLNPDLTWGSVSDIEGNSYKTVQIGTQTWMAENLRTTKLKDGSNLLTYYWYNNDPVSFKNTYGALYDWYTVNTGNLCPAGWHVPGDEEWKQLEMSLGMSRASADTSYVDFDVYGMGYRGTNQGTQMKATNGWIPWEGRGGNGTNTSGFSALPAGDTGWDYKFGGAGVCTSYWCSGEPPIARTLCTDESKVSRAVYFKSIGFSVRCLKD